MRILLVDSPTHELAQVKHCFQQSGWQVATVHNAFAAIDALAKTKFDILISLLTLPKVDGADLLKAVADKFPSIVRVLVNDGAETQAESKLAQNSHLLYDLPLDIDKVNGAIARLSASKSAITKDAIVKAVANVKTLPSPPKVYMQLNAMLKNANTDSQKISEVIAQDPALAAKVLQFSNNALMSKGKSLTSIADAITKMGVDTLCCIVMTAELFSYEPDIQDFSIVQEQLHGLSTARLAASMVKPELKQETMLAGLLHDIGKLVLYEMNPKLTQEFFKQKSTKRDNIQLESKIFGTNHAHIGGYLLHIWSFSYVLIEALVLHHSPEKLLKKSFGVAQAVYAANKLIREQELDTAFVKHYKLESVMEKLQQRAEKFRH